MPIYEYRCEACSTVFEEWHKHADDIMEQPCPSCSALAHRLISNTTFMLKGGGWYVTEYGNRKPEGPSTGAAQTSTSENAEAKSPVTPEPASGEKAAVPVTPSSPAAAD